MKFRTTISIDKYPFQIDYKSRIFGLGSCFVDNIKDKFNYYQFQNRINDFGTIFNPVSIANILQRVENQQFFNDDDVFHHFDTWKSFDLHSQFNRSEKDQLLDQINKKLQENFNFLQHTDVAVFTLGTAWVYRHKKSRKIVSNCHKVAQSEFDKVLLNSIDNPIFNDQKVKNQCTQFDVSQYVIISKVNRPICSASVTNQICTCKMLNGNAFAALDCTRS